MVVAAGATPDRRGRHDDYFAMAAQTLDQIGVSIDHGWEVKEFKAVLGSNYTELHIKVADPDVKGSGNSGN